MEALQKNVYLVVHRVGSYTAVVKQCSLVSSFHFERSEETTGREGHVDGASDEY